MMLRSLRVALAAILAAAIATVAVQPPIYAAPDTAGTAETSAAQTGVMAAECTVTYAVAAQWTTGFVANVTITNTGTEPLVNWTVTIVFPDPAPIIQQSWNITLVQSGSTVIIRPKPWNTNLPPGASVGVGFVASGTTSTPSSITCTPA